MKQKLSIAAQAKKDFEKSIASLAYSMGIWNVFEDFLDYSLLMLKWQDRKEEYFDDLRKKYPDEKQHKLFASAFFALSEIADNDGAGFADPFGDYFMEHFGNKFKGQFFTPECVCDMMAQMSIGDDATDGKTICDPCCGSGRMILSAAKLNRKMSFHAADVDINCCKMTVINMMMNSLTGEVAWMNTITMEHWKSWHIKLIPHDGHYLPYYIESGPGETKFVQRLINSMEDKKETIPINKKGQLLLFNT